MNIYIQDKEGFHGTLGTPSGSAAALHPVAFSAASFVWQSMEKMPEITVKHQLATVSNLVSFQNVNSEVIETTTVRTVQTVHVRFA